jgi:hypothetical protein
MTQNDKTSDLADVLVAEVELQQIKDDYVNPELLNELFSKDPLELTREDKLAIIRELRRGRSRFAAEDASARVAKRRVKVSKGQRVTLDDLESETLKAAIENSLAKMHTKDTP